MSRFATRATFVVCIAALTVTGAIAQATGTTVLTFPTGTPSPIPQAYGDGVTGPSSGGYGYGGSGGYTPSIFVDYLIDGGMSLQPTWWSVGYGDLVGVLWGPSTASTLAIVFMAPAGKQVALSSFDVATYAGTPETIPSITVRNHLGVPIWSQTNVTPPANPSAHLHLAFSPAPVDSQLTLEIQLPVGGLYNLGFDNIEFAEISGGVPAGQANSTAASLSVNGFGPSGIGGPWNVSITAPGTLTLAWQGPAGRPFILAAGGLNLAGLPLGCVGKLHVGTPPLLADLVVLFDGTAPGVFNGLFKLGPSGTASQTFSVPAGLGTITLQGLIFQPPSAPCPLVFTAAFQVTMM